ncbi:28368_t:CDS:2 [Dentiscutata erythropus]|uniref:28368_t:CDS:1 n=1 Tax=Dentiscutata erythropus TaxID=1348616 RepID=A0A9N9HYT0_9GLOM|nr:28368_t:CDS:2 [Dentiscutata erythropus]
MDSNGKKRACATKKSLKKKKKEAKRTKEQEKKLLKMKLTIILRSGSAIVRNLKALGFITDRYLSKTT